jgi:hypothetical protein
MDFLAVNGLIWLTQIHSRPLQTRDLAVRICNLPGENVTPKSQYLGRWICQMSAWLQWQKYNGPQDLILCYRIFEQYRMLLWDFKSSVPSYKWIAKMDRLILNGYRSLSSMYILKCLGLEIYRRRQLIKKSPVPSSPYSCRSHSILLVSDTMQGRVHGHLDPESKL